MTARLNPYLTFRNSAKDAMDFYRSLFGGEVQTMHFKDIDMPYDEDEKDKILHAQLVGDNGFVLMAADVPNQMEITPGSNYAVSLSGDDEDTLRGYWDRLIDGGEITMPLEQAPWGDSFGACNDRFGVSWMVNIAATTDR